MKRGHVAAALVVAVVWGCNFVAIDVALREFPPLLLAALRFTFVAVPAVFLVPRPPVRLRWLVAVGLLLGAGQFGFLFVGMSRGMPAGLASLVVQAQAMFTLLFAAVLLRQTPGPRLIIGTVIASAGLIGIGIGSRGSVPPLALLLVLCGSACWGAGNVCTRLANAPAGLGLVVWSGLVSPLPLLALSLAVEGPAADLHAVTNLQPLPLLGLAYVVVLSSLLGYGIWMSLMGRYPPGKVAPFSLVAPVAGLLSAWLAFGERPGPAELVGAAVVLAGLVLVVLPERTVA
jgi:O-acetylserine/cysteine efflux transporter